MSVQYLSIETCKSRNEIQIFEIYDFYVGVLNRPHIIPPKDMTMEQWRNDCEQREFANGIRNEAADILRSRLQGDELLILQAKFLSRFFAFYVIGEAKFPTDFDAYFKQSVPLGIYTPQQKEDHLMLLCGRYGEGKFVQY
jgi:hypothetical protein